MVQSGDDYREKNRIRLQRFYEKQKRQGKKRVSALVSDEAYQLLTDAKDQTGDSMSTLIDRAVMVAFGYQGQELLDIDDPALNEEIIPNFEGPGQDDTGMEPGTIEDAVNAMGGPVDSIEQDQEPDTAQADASTHVETNTQDPDTIPDCTDKTITLEERDKILLQVDEMLPGRKNVQARLNLLNRKSIPVNVESKQYPYGGEWDRKKFTDNRRQAKKRLGIK